MSAPTHNMAREDHFKIGIAGAEYTSFTLNRFCLFTSLKKHIKLATKEKIETDTKNEAEWIKEYSSLTNYKTSGYKWRCLSECNFMGFCFSRDCVQS